VSAQDPDDPIAAGELSHLRRAAAVAGIEIAEELPRRRDVDVDGLRMRYLDWGPSTGTPVLFLHGGALSAHTWDLVCAALQVDGYRSIALDLRGHGDTDWAPDGDYSIATFAADVDRFVAALDLDSFFLVGMSLGGLAAVGYAGTRSRALRGLVLVDISPQVRRPGADQVGDFVRLPPVAPSLDDFIERAIRFNPRRRRELLEHSLLRNLRPHPSGGLTWKYDPAAHTVEHHAAIRSEAAELWAQVDGIEVPTLVVRGAQSEVLTPDGAEALAHRVHDGRWVTVPNAGHTVQGDNAAGLTQVLREFFADVPDHDAA
jgi:pimeloyl-ACP methyl ester carboxylesterase